VAKNRLPETYQWLLVPVQASPQTPMSWDVLRLSGNDPLAVRASKKLRGDELLLSSLGPSRLQMELDRVPLWRGNHVAIRQLVEDFARYTYLPRLRAPQVLLNAISDGLALLTWEHDSFGLAEDFDEQATRYRGLRAGLRLALDEPQSRHLVVKAEVTRRQIATEVTPPDGPTGPGVPPVDPPPDIDGPVAPPTPPPATKMRRYHASIDLDAQRVGRDAGRIAEEVIAHLGGLVGAELSVTLEISARVEDGFPEQVVRTVTENGRALKFKLQGFESE